MFKYNLLEPTGAIILYTNDNKCHAEFRKIKGRKGQYSLGNKMPLSNDVMKSLMLAQASETAMFQFEGLIPKNVVMHNNLGLYTRTAWTRKKQKTKLWYNNKPITVMLPNCIFMAKYDSKKVEAISFGFISKLNVDNKSYVYRSPLGNYRDYKTSVCQGSMRYSQYDTVQKLMQSVEAAYFNSNFTESSNIAEIKKGFNLKKYDRFSISNFLSQ